MTALRSKLEAGEETRPDGPWPRKKSRGKCRSCADCCINND